jgi:ABC-2 type transport system ATP-binding protein
VNAIDVRGLCKHFGSLTAVENLSFSVAPSEVFGLLGPNGAGKTTTVRMLSGLLAPSAGDAAICGLDVRNNSDSVRAKIGLLTEQPGLYERLTARENLEFFIRLYEIPFSEAWSRAQHYLMRFGLAGREDEPCGQLSKGMRQKLAIIRAIVHDPPVIFLDEPTSGLDPEAAHNVRAVIAELAEEGRTIVLCSHNLSEVERLCKRVAIIRGKILASGSLRDLRREGLGLEVRLSEDAERWRQALASLPFANHAAAQGNYLRLVLDTQEQVADVVASLVSKGARIYAVAQRERPLEEIYLELIRTSDVGAGALES